MRGWCPPLDEETVTERVAARMERQAVLTRTPPVALNFVIHEAALRARVGGPEVRHGQLLACWRRESCGTSPSMYCPTTGPSQQR